MPLSSASGRSPPARDAARRAARRGLSVACLAAVALSGLSAPASAGIFGHKKPPPAPVAAPPPPPPPPPPPIAVSGHVLEAAGAYRAYMRKAADINAGFKAGPDVESALEVAEASDPQQLASGVVAYGALVALQDPAFVAGVRQYARDAAQREKIAAAIAANPAYAAEMPGAPSAAGLVIHTLNTEGGKVLGVGKLVKQAAYDVQKSAWSKAAIPDRDKRLARAKTLAAGSMSSTPEEIAALRASIPSDAGAGAPLPDVSAPIASAAPPYTPVVQRALAVAALAILGRASDDNDPAVQSLLSESTGGFCHNMAKLNLYQCLAVAKPFYEDVFCLGQHVLMDTGQCVATGVGADVVAATPLSSAALPAAPTAMAAAASPAVAVR